MKSIITPSIIGSLLSIISPILGSESIYDLIYNPRISGAIRHVGTAEPALLPLVKSPFSVLTLPATGTFELSNSEFTLYNPLSLIMYRNNLGTLTAHLIRNSYDISGMSPNKVSAFLSERLRDGADFEMQTDFTYFQYSKSSQDIPGKGISFRLSSEANSSLHLPGDFFNLIFSNTNGGQKGNTLSFSSLSSEIEVSSKLEGSYGKLTSNEIKLFGNPFALSWGVTGAYKMGHLLFQLDTHEAEAVFGDNNTLSIRSNVKMSTSGVSLNKKKQYETSTHSGGVINGHGASLSGDLALSNSNFLLSCGVDDLGFMAWGGSVQRQNLSFSDDSLYLMDLNDSAFSGGQITRDTDTKPIIRTEKTSLNFKFSAYNKARKVKNRAVQLFSSAQAATIGCQQPLTKDRFNSRNPHLFVSLENEMFSGAVPIRVGWDYQNRHNYSSFIEFQESGKGMTISLWYRAQNDMMFRSLKGSEVGIRSHIYW